MRKKFLSVLMVMVMGTALTACAGSNKDKAAANESNLSTQKEQSGNDSNIAVNVILKTTASEYWGYVMAGCEAYSKDHPNVKVNVQGASSETAYDEQLNIIETNLASNEYDGFVIAPLQADMVIDKISGQKKPIIAVDTSIEAPEVLSFVGTGNENAAYEGGKAAIEMAKEAGWKDLKAIAISGVQGDSTATARLSGYEKGIEEAGGEFLKDEVQYADAVADKAYSCMEAVMQNHPDGVAIIVCNNDDMAIASARAAKDNKAYANTVFVGFDGIQSACKAILAGEETMSVAQNAYDMGYKSVETCVKSINGEKVDDFIDSGSSIINKDNAQEQLDKLQSYLGK